MTSCSAISTRASSTLDMAQVAIIPTRETKERSPSETPSMAIAA